MGETEGIFRRWTDLAHGERRDIKSSNPLEFYALGAIEGLGKRTSDTEQEIIMTITAHTIFATIIPLIDQCDGRQRAYVAFMALKAALEVLQPDDRPIALVDAMAELRLMLYDLNERGYPL